MISSTTSHSSFEEFYAEWYPKALGEARARKLPDPEGVASDIMMVFLEKDYLEKHDPTVDGAASFSTWVNNIMNHRMNNVHRNMKRRPIEVPLSAAENEPIEDTALVEFKLLAVSVFELLEDRYGIELAEVFVSVVKQVTEDSTAKSGSVRQWLTAKHLGIGKTEVSDRIKALRLIIMGDAELRELLGADRWTQQAA